MRVKLIWNAKNLEILEEQINHECKTLEDAGMTILAITVYPHSSNSCIHYTDKPIEA